MAVILLDPICVNDSLIGGRVVRGSSERAGNLGHDRESAVGAALNVPDLDGSVPPRIVVPYFGNCTNPVRLASTLGRDVEYGVRCRRCPGCLRARRFLWKLRAEAEVFQAHQSFLFTGTYRAQYLDLEPVSLSVTLWLKRLRERIGEAGSLRYLVAFERHRSGAWHMHALLHDTVGLAGDVRNLSGLAWRDGFSNCKTVDVRGAGYVTKYVSKDLESFGATAVRHRVRASRNPMYGAVVMAHQEEIVRELQRRRVDLGQVWNVNVRDILRFATKKDDAWKEILSLRQTSGDLLLSNVRDVPGETPVLTYRKVDRETGEITEE